MDKENMGEEKIKPNFVISVGLENYVLPQRIIAVVSVKSAPVKRMIKGAEEKNMLIDATCGKPTRSAVITDSNHIILSSLAPKKIAMRIEGGHHNRAYE
jgi:regulator of extracellular matrix RemA (YlzA/DUF370 family)